MAVIGAGVGGLAAAMDLARSGFAVTVYERSAAPGGKLREVQVEGHGCDAGPSVFTLREIFDDLFAAGGEHFDAHVKLTRADVLARHAWDASGALDLYADVRRSSQAIAEFSGLAEARGFDAFTAHARRMFTTLQHSFIRAPRPSPWGLVRRLKLAGLADLWNIQPFTTLWKGIERYFKDPRLAQLFGRYATYCGSSPFSSPATLMLIAHVEQSGVWYIEGGMHGLAKHMAAAAARHGAAFRYSSDVLRICIDHGRVRGLQLSDGDYVEVDAVICNCDTNALASGRFGEDARRGSRATRRGARSLSAVTWNLRGRTSGFELAHHSVFFSPDYRAEFDDIFRRSRVPAVPTIYVCAQDRCDTHLPNSSRVAGDAAERLFCLINAPATGDIHDFDTAEMQQCEARLMQRLDTYGLKIDRRSDPLITTPTDFNRLFPATGGALYGPASHGWRASFNRPGSRSRIPGLYLAGGSTHPGPGVPMAVTSGRLAAACLGRDYASTSR